MNPDELLLDDISQRLAGAREMAAKYRAALRADGFSRADAAHLTTGMLYDLQTAVLNRAVGS